MKRFSYKRRRWAEAYVFILPWLIGFALFFIQPIINSLRLSFGEIKQIGTLHTTFVGFRHYITAFVADIEFLPIFKDVLMDTLVQTPLVVVLSLIIAVMMNQRIRGRGVFRMIFFMPVVLGSGFIMQQLLEQGVQNQAVAAAKGLILSDKTANYLGAGVTGTVSQFMDTIVLVLWKSGVQIVLFLGGLQGIQPSIYESARVDAATEWELFWMITLPMMSPTILLCAIFTIVDSFTDSSNSMLNYIYQEAFGATNNFEYAAALGWIYFAVVAVIIAVVYKAIHHYIQRLN